MHDDIVWANLIETIVYALVDDKESVEITYLKGHQATIVEVRVAREEIGKVIGKQGKTADAIRTIIGSVTAASKRRYVLQVIDD